MTDKQTPMGSTGRGSAIPAKHLSHNENKPKHASVRPIQPTIPSPSIPSAFGSKTYPVFSLNQFNAKAEGGQNCACTANMGVFRAGMSQKGL